MLIPLSGRGARPLRLPKLCSGEDKIELLRKAKSQDRKTDS